MALNAACRYLISCLSVVNVRGSASHAGLVIADPEISRTHLEIRLDAIADQAVVIDTSTNGTLLNGMRLARAVPAPLKPGDEIRIADAAMVFRSQRFTAAAMTPGVTRTRISQTAMVMVVGDIINYSTISEVTDEGVIAQSLHTLWHEVGGVPASPSRNAQSLRRRCDIRDLGGEQVPRCRPASDRFRAQRESTCRNARARTAVAQPGWLADPHGLGCVVVGTVALAAMTRSVEAVIGDSTNVAFRLAGLAGRQGRASVMVTSGARRTAEAHFRWGEGEQVELKGRRGKETVFAVLGRQTSGTDTAPGRSDVARQDITGRQGNREPTAELPVHKTD